MARDIGPLGGERVVFESYHLRISRHTGPLTWLAVVRGGRVLARAGLNEAEVVEVAAALLTADEDGGA